MSFIIKTRKTIQNRRITHPFLFQARTTSSVCKETFVLETLSFYIFISGQAGVVVSLCVSTIITSNSEIKYQGVFVKHGICPRWQQSPKKLFLA